MTSILLTDISYLKGVGPLRAKTMKKELDIATFGDLLYDVPYKYIDRSAIVKVSDLNPSAIPAYVLLYGVVVSKQIEGGQRGERLSAMFGDGSGYVELVWFSGVRAMEKRLRINQPYLLLGKPSVYKGTINISHPELDEVHSKAELVGMPMKPHYHLTDKCKRMGITSKLISGWVNLALEKVLRAGLPDTLPAYLREKYELMGLAEALTCVHRPQDNDGLNAAVRRLKFEELFYLQLDVLRTLHQRKKLVQGVTFPRVGERFMQFYQNHLPFELTDAQKRVVKEIRQDVLTGHQMNRLVQGDVGSGKTIVALLACLLALDNGFQACIMAPTEILAEQHYQSIAAYLDGIDCEVALLTGSVKGKQRKTILAGLERGDVQIIIGTHALIEPTVKFQNLGLAVIDEQHRFGVKQRAMLWEKNVCPPHVLVMTATPIPRTLAMTVYGDLDVSAIDQLPPGRKAIRTVHYRQSERRKLVDGVRWQLEHGQQVYVVYPLIKENEKLDIRDVETGYERLKDLFPDFGVGMLHGKMKPADKEEVMEAFKQNKIQLLVSTTVIEVGVNVPNASVMIIENAERFGLSQLHQLRGRVGRGSAQSYCILVTKDKLSETTLRRMQVMVESTDGFLIAEEDMRLRGPGDVDGTAQSGMLLDLKIANIVKDADLMVQARDAANDLMQRDPNQNLPQNVIVWQTLQRKQVLSGDYSDIS